MIERCRRCGYGVYITDFGEPVCHFCGFRPAYRPVRPVRPVRLVIRYRPTVTKEPPRKAPRGHETTCPCGDPLLMDVVRFVESCPDNCHDCIKRAMCEEIIDHLPTERKITPEEQHKTIAALRALREQYVLVYN
jgi:hypothetical protein